MNSKTIYGFSCEEIRAQIEETIVNQFKPTLAIAFMSYEHDFQTFQSIFNEFDIDLFGATSAGELVDNQMLEKSIGIMLLDMKKDCYQICHKRAEYSTTKTACQEIAQTAKSTFNNPAFIVTFSLTVSGEHLIEGFSTEFDKCPIIFGGMAADDLRMAESYTFTNTDFDKDGLTTLIIDNDRININGHAVCGWEPFGLKNTITKAKDNVIYQINNEPALDVFISFFGDYHDNTESEETVSVGVAQYPLQLVRNGQYVLRAPLIADEEKRSLVVAGPVKDGDEFHFSIAPGFEIIEETLNGFSQFHYKYPKAEAILLFSCKARHLALGPMVGEEVEGIQQLWKKPLLGFFSYGEIGQQGGLETEFYNETCCLVLLSEK